MGIVVNTNVSSILVQRSLGSATKQISNSLEKLSTGFKINRAADDAAGLVISESLRAQARGATQASANAQTGVNLLQTAEADLGIVQENLQRIRDLTVQASNGTYGTTERTAIFSEVNARTQEIDRIAKSSAFNTIKLLDGSNTALVLQIGSGSAASLNSLTIGGPLSKATSSTLGLGTAAEVSAAFGTVAAAASFLSNIDTAISTVSTRRSEIGSLQNRLDSAIKSLAIKQENMLAADSRIRDTDVSKEAANLTKNQILQQASASLLAQANQSPQIALSLLQ
ncbi:MAG: flagellin [Candidatus Gastranaerophilales bacterium]|nr:flagellin [Candidatus Gastranaerophilales bacterium]